MKMFKRIPNSANMKECFGCNGLITIEHPDHPFDDNYTIRACAHTPPGIDVLDNCPCKLCLIKCMCKCSKQYMCEKLKTCRDEHREKLNWRPLYEARDNL